MVTYKNLAKSPNLYRKFKSKTTNLGDASLINEVILRRYKRVKEEALDLPSLILIDGGALQVNAALDALKKLDLNLKVWLVKNNKHKLEYIYYDKKEIYLEKNDSLFLFLENIQDETHRYAISYYRSIHAKSNLESEVSKIKGIGKVKLNKILKALAASTDVKETLERLNLTVDQRKALEKLIDKK